MKTVEFYLYNNTIL